LILTDRFFPEEFIINDLVLELQQAGFIMDVLTQQPSYPSGNVKQFKGFKNKIFTRTRWNGITVYRIFTIQGYKKSVFLKILHYFHFAMMCSMVMLIKGRTYGKIFITQTGPLTQALPAVLSKKIYKNKLMIWTLDLWPDAVYAYGFKKNSILTSLLSFIVKSVYSNMDAIAVSSAAFKDRIMEYSPAKRIHFIPQWSEIKANNETCSVKLDPNALNISFAGNIGTSQNLERILLGFQIAQTDNHELILNLFGDGNNLESLKRLVADQKIENVVFWGRLPQSQMHAVLTQSDVLLISLKPDPLFEMYIPLKFPAYLSVGKPIFAVISGEVKRLTIQYNVGVVSDPADIMNIAEGFSAFTKLNETDFTTFAENTKALSASLFNKEQIINSVKSLLTDL